MTKILIKYEVDKDEDELITKYGDDPTLDTNKIFKDIKKIYANYNLKYSDDRKQKVGEALENPKFKKLIYSKHFPTKQLSEDGYISKKLEQMADYLLRPKFINEQHELEYENDADGIVKNNHGRRKKYHIRACSISNNIA